MEKYDGPKLIWWREEREFSFRIQASVEFYSKPLITLGLRPVSRTNKVRATLHTSLRRRHVRTYALACTKPPQKARRQKVSDTL